MQDNQHEPFALENTDLRVLTGKRYRGEQPVMLDCPFHNDTDASFGVFWDHGHCFSRACKRGRFVRRYALAAWLLGMWDGRESTELDGVRTLTGKLRAGKVLTPPSPVIKQVMTTVTDEEVARMATTFQRYLFSDSAVDTNTGVPMLQTLKEWRGYSEHTIRDFGLGWTGSHFSIPVSSVSGAVRSIRYRTHPLLRGLPRYEGLAGRNEQSLFSLPHVIRGQKHAGRWGEDLWIVEGEFDHIACVQLGGWSVTVTNGAGSLDSLLEQFTRLRLTVRRWIWATDQDDAGEEAAHRLSQQVPVSYRAYWSAGKDINSYMLAGGDLSSVSMRRMTNT